MTAAAGLSDLAFRQLCRRFHRLGDRVMAEFLDELGAGRMLRQPLEELLARYVDALDVQTLRVLGGAELQPPPLRLVPPVNDDS
jgi:hypothetical protein